MMVIPVYRQEFLSPFKVGQLVQFFEKDGGYNNVDCGGYEFLLGEKLNWVSAANHSTATVLEIDTSSTLKVYHHDSGMVLCTNNMYLKHLWP